MDIEHTSCMKGGYCSDFPEAFIFLNLSDSFSHGLRPQLLQPRQVANQS